MKPVPKERTKRWRRVFALRRAFTEQIILAGMRDNQPWVCLTDHLDDVIYQALKKEAQLATRRRGR